MSDRSSSGRVMPRFVTPKAKTAAMRLLSTYGTIVALALMIVVFSVAEPGTFATFSNFRNIFNDMSIATIIAAGLTLPLVGGDFDLSIGYVASFSGLLVIGLLSNGHWPIPLAILAVIGVGVARLTGEPRFDAAAGLFVALTLAGLPAPWPAIISALAGFGLRAAAIARGLALPAYRE